MLSRDEFVAMCEWAFGDDWMSVNVKHAPSHFELNHPEFPPLEMLDVPNPGLNSSYYLTQIYYHWEGVRHNQIYNNLLNFGNKHERNCATTDNSFTSRLRKLIGF